MTKITDRLMTPAEVASYYAVDAKTVTRWALAGRLPVARITPGGHRRFWESDVKAAGLPKVDAHRPGLSGHTITVEDGRVVERSHGDLVKVCASGAGLDGVEPEAVARDRAALYGATYVPAATR